MAPTSKATQSDSPVAAAELKAQQDGTAVEDTLDQDVKDQEAQQKAELRAGKQGVSSEDKSLIELAKVAPAGARVGHEAQAPTVMGKMDQMSRRNAGEALEGHFVVIDKSVKGVEEAYQDARLIRGPKDERGEYEHTGYFGVYLQPAAIDPETGIPVTAVVRLRDSTNALVRVPYESLSPAGDGAGGR